MRATIVRYDLQLGSLAARPGLLVRDAFLVQNYDPGTILTGIGPAWSLAIEAVFYLALPILVLVAFALARRAKKESRRRRLALLPPVVMLIVGFSGKLVASTVVPGGAPDSGGSTTGTRFWSEASGCRRQPLPTRSSGGSGTGGCWPPGATRASC